jgi:hypothetical protein
MSAIAPIRHGLRGHFYQVQAGAGTEFQEHGNERADRTRIGVPIKRRARDDDL